MGNIPKRMDDLIRKAQGLIGSVDARFDGGTVFSVEELLRSALSLEEDREKRVQVSYMLNEFKEYYRGLASNKTEANAQVVIRDTQAYAYLTLLPPRSGGKSVKFPDVMREVQSYGISEGLNHAALEAAVEKMVKKDETVWSLEVASCALPDRGSDATVEFKVPVFDKSLVFSEEPVSEDLAPMIQNIEAGKVVAEISPAQEGSPGVSVRGEEIPPLMGEEIKLKFGGGVKESGDRKSVTSTVNGAVVLSEDSVDVVPFYVVTGDLLPEQDVSHNGHVLVTGNVVGPVTVRAEDIYVAGNVEGATLSASGDVYVGAGIVGKKTGTVEADGRVFARSISDATLQVLGDVVVRNSITYSEVTSNGEVRVVAEKGALVGGTISALKAITAKSVGSDFGTYTSTAVGVDFLTPKRLNRINDRIREYEENLAKIDKLKQKLLEAKVDVTKLPPDKQDLYISVLQKEIKTREELNSLKRSKEKFDMAFHDFLQASIHVMENLHPPVKVQIGKAIEEIRERMHHVTLVLDRDKIQAKKED